MIVSLVYQVARKLLSVPATAPLTDLNTRRWLIRTRVLGGLINDYRYTA